MYQFGQLETIHIATLGTAVTVIIAFPIAFLSARNTSPNHLTWLIGRFILVTSRSVNTVVWGLLFVAIFGPGPMAGDGFDGFKVVDRDGQYDQQGRQAVDRRPRSRDLERERGRVDLARALGEQREQVDKVLGSLLRPLIDQALSVVFYDLTTISTEGLTQQEDDVRHYGFSKEGGVRRQFVLGVVQTAEGLPIYHEVFDGNVAEVSTLRGTLETVMKRFPIRRVIAVADRGLLSLDNLTELQTLTTPSGEPLEFILAVPGRRYAEFESLLTPFHRDHCQGSEEAVVGEVSWQSLRLVIAHDPSAAAERTAERDRNIKAPEDLAAGCNVLLHAMLRSSA